MFQEVKLEEEATVTKASY